MAEEIKMRWRKVALAWGAKKKFNSSLPLLKIFWPSGLAAKRP